MDINQNRIKNLEGFIDMLRAACDDEDMKNTLVTILSMPNEERKSVVVRLVDNLNNKGAPTQLIEFFSSLTDDTIAEKAHEALFQQGI